MSGLNTEGYYSELFSSIQGEGGTVKGSCFGKRQIFVRLAGCNLASGDFGSNGCFWCDSPQAKSLHSKTLQYEVIPGSQELLSEENPIKSSKIISLIQQLITPDLHSISFTGGEPLHQLDHLLNISTNLQETIPKYPLYLETNGSIELEKEQMDTLATNFRFCCCDIKDRSSNAASEDQWKKLVNQELGFIEDLITMGVETYAKLVVTSQTTIEDIKWIGKKLSEIHYSNGLIAGLAIQPVTIENKDYKKDISVNTNQLNEIFQEVAQFIPSESLTLSIQAHKLINIL